MIPGPSWTPFGELMGPHTLEAITRIVYSQGPFAHVFTDEERKAHDDKMRKLPWMDRYPLSWHNSWETTYGIEEAVAKGAPNQAKNTPDGVLFKLDGQIYWGQTGITGLRLADEWDIAGWKQRTKLDEVPRALEASMVVEFRVWNGDLLFATDEKTGNVVLEFGERDVEGDEHFAKRSTFYFSPTGYEASWFKREGD